MIPTTPEFGTLRYLYLGTGAFEPDKHYFQDVLGAPKRWEFHAFGARVAAFALGSGPELLLNDHHPSGTLRLIYAVPDAAALTRTLEARGWKADGEAEIPTGTCVLFTSPGGQTFGFVEERRPQAMVQAYRDEANANAVQD